MTPKQKQYKKDLIKIIHIAQKRSLLDDENYRALLLEQFGACSSTELSIDELKELALMLGYKKLATKPERRDAAVAYEFASGRRGGATPRQVGKILELWEQKAQNKERASLMRFCARMLRPCPLRLGLLSAKDASKIITALEALK